MNLILLLIVITLSLIIIVTWCFMYNLCISIIDVLNAIVAHEDSSEHRFINLNDQVTGIGQLVRQKNKKRIVKVYSVLSVKKVYEAINKLKVL